MCRSLDKQLFKQPKMPLKYNNPYKPSKIIFFMKNILRISEQTSTDQTTFLRYGLSGRRHSGSYEIAESPKKGTYLIIVRKNTPLVVWYKSSKEKAKKIAHRLAKEEAEKLLTESDYYSEIIDDTKYGKLEKESTNIPEKEDPIRGLFLNLGNPVPRL
jgi:hypothetical protein